MQVTEKKESGRFEMMRKEERMSKFTAEQAATDSSEIDIIRQAQQGDALAFEQLYKKHSKKVYNLCLRMSRNPTEAEDLTQQAFLQLFRKIGTFRGESGLATWLHKVTVNVVLMHIRRKKPTEVLAESLEGDTRRRGSYARTRSGRHLVAWGCGQDQSVARAAQAAARVQEVIFAA